MTLIERSKDILKEARLGPFCISSGFKERRKVVEAGETSSTALESLRERVWVEALLLGRGTVLVIRCSLLRVLQSLKPSKVWVMAMIGKFKD